MATITSTFYLKNASVNNESLIMFQCNFKHEEKRFYYSTGETILPKHWDFINRKPIKRGANRSLRANSIDIQLNRYIETFEKIQTRCKLYGEEFTSQLLRDGFDSEFFHGKDWELNKNRIKTNREFWQNKIEQNIYRDKLVNKTLIDDGWIVIRFWGTEIKKNLDRCVDRILDAVNNRNLNNEV